MRIATRSRARWHRPASQLTELSTHLQGQLVAVHPAYDEAFDGFAPAAVRGNRSARQAWAVEQLMKAARASARLGLTAHATFSGALAWPYIYPWPQRPPGLIETAFDTLAARWRPILDAFDAAGVDVCFEIHPGEDLHDGASFEMFLARVGNHPRCKILYDPSHFVLQQLDYLGFIDLYHERIGAFHVKDAEFNPTARQGVYGGYQSWVDRAGRFRSLGDGQVNFRGIFSQACAIRIRRLGGAGVGVRHQVGGTGCARRRAVHPRPHDPGDGQGVRRLRRGRHGRCGEPPHARAGLRQWLRTIACASAWSAADRAPSSAQCTASPRGWTTPMSWSAARCRPIRNAPVLPAPRLGLDPARSYGSYTEMFAAERTRPDGMEVVAIVTPNHLHYPVARAALAAGFHVICDKPLATSVAEADELVQLAADADRIFAVTYNYSGYPMVRQARAMVARGDIGALRVVQVEYAAGLARRTAGGHRTEAGSLANRSGAVRTRRCDRRHRQPCVPSRLLRHRPRARTDPRRSLDLRCRPTGR